MGKEKPIIMLVDDNMASLTMGKNILKDKFDVYPISSGEKFFEILEKVFPDLILLDIAMPEMDGYEVIKRLKASRKNQDIPVIFLTSRDDPGNELEGLSLGAVDYVSKPFSPALLVQRIENHLLLDFRKKQLEKYNQQLKELAVEYASQSGELMFATLGALAEALEFRESNIGSHGKRILEYFKIMLEELNEKNIYQEEISKWDLHFLLPASKLHDLGKLFLSEDILHKKSKLTPDEFAEIKKHPDLGVSLVDQIAPDKKDHVFITYASIIAGSHHERWDGSGYPKGLKGTEIPLLGRFMALIDGYDAMISSRPYREALSTLEAEKNIIEGKNSWLDPVLADVFVEIAHKFAEIANRKN